MSKRNNDNCTHGDDNEDNDSSTEGENDKMLVFVRSIPDDSPETNRGISEVEIIFWMLQPLEFNIKDLMTIGLSSRFYRENLMIK